jgi:mycofactocin precursor
MYSYSSPCAETKERDMAPTATDVLDPAEISADRDEAGTAGAAEVRPDEIIASDLLVEEISIDGMCGVY